jgi:hypothetical protein
MPRLMSTEAALARDVMSDVRAACEKSGRPVEELEIQQALEGLDASELRQLQRVSREPLAARPLGPQALLDIVRGVQPRVAAAREISGYYDLKAERDALATLARRGAPVQAEPEPEPAPEPEPPAAPLRSTPASTPATSSKTLTPEQQSLLTLFAYHRDGVRVAQEPGIGATELADRVEQLGLRRRIHRLLESTTDIDMFSPARLGAGPVQGNRTPLVRRRSTLTEEPESTEPALTPAEPPPTPTAQTTPVNAHGTRVYRRLAAVPRAEQEGAAQPRREYVREVRRRPKTPAAPKPSKASKAAPPVPTRRAFLDLQSAGGAAILERLLADEKANPRVLASRLAERFDGPDRPLNESDLRQLLQHHGLAESFREREIANTRFLIGFHQGARSKLASALQMTPDELTGYLSRIGLSGDLERTRAERARLELGRRRINDRIVQVLTRAPYLDDLGVLPVIDREVRDYLQEQLSARGGLAAAEEIRNDLGLEKNAFAKLLRRYALSGAADE